MRTVLVLNGPNLAHLGIRDPEVYGSASYANLVATVTAEAVALGLGTDIRQSNDEAELIGWLHEALAQKQDVIINPAAFTHYSYALRDAAEMLTKSGLKLIEVHISNPSAREGFRHTSVISGVATGTIAGLGINSYLLALRFLAN